jgi:hypothetical protein
MAGSGTDLPVMPKKPAARQKKVMAALSPTAASPEVMMPVVALDDVVTGQQQAPEKKKDKSRDKDRIKPKKQKLVRDSFTMPEQEYETLAEMKKNCIKAGISVKKSELLRVAVSLLRKMDVPQVQQALTGLTPVRAGRPSKQK